MNIWFGTTTAKWPRYKRNYFRIRDYLKELKCNVLFDWLETADHTYENDLPRDLTRIYNEVISAIDKADAIVIEYTVPNFSSSHQINYALLKKKPILVMRQQKDNPHYNGSYLDALQSNLLTVKNYTIDNYKDILHDFVGNALLDEKQQRYNIVLGAKQKQYLDWASFEYRKSRSQIIKDLLDEKAVNDLKYKK